MSDQPIDIRNLFAAIDRDRSDELFEMLLQTPGVRLERIVSTGQATPPGKWYDQEGDEWVALLSGAARLRFESSDSEHELQPGDYLLIPAHCRHRVEWTSADEPTVWLALHITSQATVSLASEDPQ
ncbi:cupin domain-containing protein [bacterium]|nr:cupin domain-containing protein [bacterium]